MWKHVWLNPTSKLLYFYNKANPVTQAGRSLGKTENLTKRFNNCFPIKIKQLLQRIVETTTNETGLWILKL